MEWEGQPSAAPMDAVRATRHHSCTAVPAHAEWDSGEGERRSEGGHQMGADHTLCMACMMCSHHPNHTFHPVTTPCRWHVDRQRGRRGREKREEGAAHSFPPSHIQLTHTTTPHLLSFLSLPPSHLSSTHHTHTHTIISIDLPDNHHITAHLTQPTSPHTHTHTHTNPKPTPMHVPVHKETQQQQQQPHHSRSSPPAAHVLLHLHATHAHTSSKWYMCE